MRPVRLLNFTQGNAQNIIQPITSWFYKATLLIDFSDTLSVCRFALRGSAVKAEPFIYFAGIGVYGGALPLLVIFRKAIDYSNASEKGSYLPPCVQIQIRPQGEAG